MEQRKVAILLFISIFCACAQVKNESAENIEMKTLNAFVSVYYPNAILIDSKDSTQGYYLFLKQTGTITIPDTCQLLLDYNVHTPNEIKRISKTTLEQQARLYGLFSYDQHYIPDKLLTEQIRENILNVIKTMKAEDSLVLILPSWRANTGGTLWANTNNSSTPLIYNITLKEVIKDPKTIEIDTIKSFIQKCNADLLPDEDKFFSVDSIPNFYIRYIDTTKRVDTVAASQNQKTITLEYAGYFTDRFMFDSNINKLLLKKNPTVDTTSTTITESNTKKSSYIYSTDSTQISYIQGFHKAFQFLKKGDKAEFFFSSDYGYGKYGNTSIFGYTPLRFYIHIKDVN